MIDDNLNDSTIHTDTESEILVLLDNQVSDCSFVVAGTNNTQQYRSSQFYLL